MIADWKNVTGKDSLPDKTPEASEISYLGTFVHEDGSRETIVTEWGPVAKVRLQEFLDDPLYRHYIYDGWAFGDKWYGEIDTINRIAAWDYMPDPYMGR